MLYEELRRIARGYMRREGGGERTLDPTGLVNEAMVRILADPKVRDRADRADRAYVAGAALQAMRRILVDRSRERRRVKRGGRFVRVPLDAVLDRLEERSRGDVVRLDEALKELETHDQRLAEVVTLRFFLGLKIREIAARVGRSRSTVESDLALARAWLRSRLSEKEPAGSGA